MLRIKEVLRLKLDLGLEWQADRAELFDSQEYGSRVCDPSRRHWLVK